MYTVFKCNLRRLLYPVPYFLCPVPRSSLLPTLLFAPYFSAPCCSLHTLRCTLFVVSCALYAVPCTSYSVAPCNLYSFVPCTLYSFLPSTVYSVVPCTLFPVVLGTLYSVVPCTGVYHSLCVVYRLRLRPMYPVPCTISSAVCCVLSTGDGQGSSSCGSRSSCSGSGSGSGSRARPRIRTSFLGEIQDAEGCAVAAQVAVIRQSCSRRPVLG